MGGTVEFHAVHGSERWISQVMAVPSEDCGRCHLNLKTWTSIRLDVRVEDKEVGFRRVFGGTRSPSAFTNRARKARSNIDNPVRFRELGREFPATGQNHSAPKPEWGQIFPYVLIFPSTDCARERNWPIIRPMSPLLSPIELFGSEKLEILQRLDRYRKWGSLDEKRYCLACGHIIDGHGIVIVGGTRGTGPLRLICPTERCHAIPMDWVLPTDQVLTRMSMLEEKAVLPRKRSKVAHREKFSVRLRRFALQFRPAA